MSSAEEITEKMAAQHAAGQHSTGPQAGCPVCAELTAARETVTTQIAGASPVEALNELAARRQRREKTEATEAPGLARLAAAAAVAFSPPVDNGTLGTVALEDAQQALDDLSTLAEAGIVVPNAQQAVAHALVGQVRATVGVEAALLRIAEAVELIASALGADDDPDPEGEYTRPLSIEERRQEWLHANAGVPLPPELRPAPEPEPPAA